MISELIGLLSTACRPLDPLTADLTRLSEPELGMLYEKAFKRLDQPHTPPPALLSQFHSLKDEIERRKQNNLELGFEETEWVW